MPIIAIREYDVVSRPSNNGIRSVPSKNHAVGSIAIDCIVPGAPCNGQGTSINARVSLRSFNRLRQSHLVGYVNTIVPPPPVCPSAYTQLSLNF